MPYVGAGVSRSVREHGMCGSLARGNEKASAGAIHAGVHALERSNYGLFERSTEEFSTKECGSEEEDAARHIHAGTGPRKCVTTFFPSVSLSNAVHTKYRKG